MWQSVSDKRKLFYKKYENLYLFEILLKNLLIETSSKIISVFIFLIISCRFSLGINCRWSAVSNDRLGTSNVANVDCYRLRKCKFLLCYYFNLFRCPGTHSLIFVSVTFDKMFRNSIWCYKFIHLINHFLKFAKGWILAFFSISPLISAFFLDFFAYRSSLWLFTSETCRR